ncbi:MAG: SGNH/GDSL hydrolase family protein [Candidatus Methylomirabilia bacterium]
MRNVVAKTLLAVSSVVLALLAAEIAVRILRIPPNPAAPLPIPSYRLSANPVIGYEYRPGNTSSEESFDDGHRGFVINSAGFRDSEHEANKPADVFRIVVLGDSTTAGNGTAFEKIYTTQLEALLNSGRTGGRRYEVLNMGVGGYHTLQEIETLRTKGLAYHPDLVLVTFCLNDFFLQSDGGVYERLQKDNHLSAEPILKTASKTLLDRILRVSRLAFVVFHRLNLPGSTYEQWYSREVLRGQSPTRIGFTLLSQLQRKYGFSAYVLILPEFSSPFSEYQSYGFHNEVTFSAEGLSGFTIIDLLPYFALLDNNPRSFSSDSIHLNENGHEAMAGILLPLVRKAAGK